MDWHSGMADGSALTTMEGHGSLSDDHVISVDMVDTGNASGSLWTAGSANTPVTESAGGVSLSAASAPPTQTAQPGPIFSALIAGEAPGYTTMMGAGPFMPPAMPVLIEGPVSITQAPGALMEMPAWVTPGQPNVSIELPAIYRPGQQNTLMQLPAVIGPGQINPAAFFGANQSQGDGQGTDADFGDLVAHRLAGGHRWNYDKSGRRDFKAGQPQSWDEWLGNLTFLPAIIDELGRRSLDKDGNFVGVGQPGFLEGFLPFWPGLRGGFDHYQHGEYREGTIDLATVGLDLILVGALVRQARRGWRLGGWLAREATTEGAEEALRTSGLPQQVHHFATNKSNTFTPKLKKIANTFGLDLNGAWNKEVLPQLGRHPNKYHDFVLRNMERAAREAGGDTARFLELFEKYVKDPIRKNPDLLRKSGWR
jgi:hypothetical protein